MIVVLLVLDFPRVVLEIVKRGERLAFIDVDRTGLADRDQC